MAIRTVLQYPDPRLRLKANPVVAFDPALRALVQDMIETMFAEDGMGLAAPQINIQQMVIVMNFSRADKRPFAVINPRILQATGEQVTNEYCLSVPEIGIPVKRATHLHVSFYDEWGQEKSLHVEGIEARCFQHEMDHLLGRVTVDYLSPLKRSLYERKLFKLRKQSSKQSRLQNSQQSHQQPSQQSNQPSNQSLNQQNKITTL